MFFEEYNIQIAIRDVFLIKRKNETIYTAKKPEHSLGYRLRGDGVFYYKKEIIRVERGEAIHVPPCISYHQKSREEAIIVIHFDASGTSSQDISLAHFSDTDQADGKFYQLLDVWNSRQPGYRYRAQSIFYDILADIQQQYYIQADRTDKKELQLMPSMEYLHRNYYKPDLNIRDIAAASHVSEVYFRRLFQEVYQMSPWKYISRLRIAKAMTLLKADDTPVKTVAGAVGFADPLYFSRVFKKVTGFTPVEFRGHPEVSASPRAR